MKIQLKNTNTLLVKVHNSDTENMVCDFAIVTITKDLLDTISKLRKARENVDFYEITKFDSSINFLNQDDFAWEDGEETISEELTEELEAISNDGAGVWRVEIEKDQPMLRTEADLICVGTHGIRFTAIKKYSDIRLVTDRISFEMLEDL